MDFHFRSQNVSQSPNVNRQVNNPSDNGFISYLKEYFGIRFRQLGIFFNYFFVFSGVLVAEIKNRLVRNMYWGRTSFYKSAFHIVIVVITFIALSTGLSARLVSPQRDFIENIRVSSRTTIDTDLVAQQGSLVPLQILTEDSDNVYIEYLVNTGDTLEGIATEQGINVDTIRWANNMSNTRKVLTPGDLLKIPKMNGVLHTVKEGDTVDKILAKVTLKDKDADKSTFLDLNTKFIASNGVPIVGSIVFIPEAVIPKPVVKTTPSGGGGTFVAGSGGDASIPAGTFVNPMQNCSYSHSRGYSYGHTGVDLASSTGCWIVAAGSGTVIRAGWCYSLGYCVAIRHANGYSTLYGHSNGVLGVKTGQKVSAGQNIAQIGCTGRCTGPHVHLSMTANNQDAYSCYRCRINPAGKIPY